MKVPEKQAKELGQKLKTLEPGNSLEFPGFLPGLSKAPVVALLGLKEKDYWEFEAHWHGVHLGRFCLYYVEGQLMQEAM